MEKISVEDLTFRYLGGTEPAISDVCLRVSEGDVVGLYGPSGSGKSTILKSINGLIPHRYAGDYSGRVLVEGEEVAKLPLYAISTKVGTVLQEIALQFVMSIVEDDIAFGPTNLGLSREEVVERVEFALKTMEIGDLRGRHVDELSGGQMQRVAIAGVLALMTDTLLFDEPMANLDSNGVNDVARAIGKLRDMGKTIIISEHRVEEVQDLVGPDWFAVVVQGKVDYSGREIEGLSRYVGLIRLPPELLLMAENPPLPEGPPEVEPGGKIVEVEDLWIEYPNGVVALKGANLEVREGEAVALLGNNGAGKSTLALSMAGLLDPTSGRVLIEGKDARDLKPKERAAKVGIVMQDPYSMIFAKTTREEIGFGPKNLGLRGEELERRVVEAAEMCGVSHLLDRSPFSGSHGEKKRITVASILSMRPKLVILDEPTAGQDYRSYTRFMNFVMRLMRMGAIKSLIVITHDTDVAIEYTNRAIVMNDGRIIADGPTREVLMDEGVLRRAAIRETGLIRMSRKLGSDRILRLRELYNLKMRGKIEA